MSRIENAFSSNMLSDRQIQCLQGVANGLNSKQIARDLGIAPSTVDNHVAIAVRLLGCSSRAEAARKVTMPKSEPVIRHPTGRWLPPIGGKPNTDSPAERIRQIFTVSLLGLAVSAAGIATIAGLVHVFGK